MLKLFGFSLLFLCFSNAVTAQNTKGDRPVKNQRIVRETRAKSVRKKEKGGRTRDIANRRLRTKGTSSANRANANYPRQTPYVGTKSQEDRSAKPRGRVFSRSPRESKTRAWKGDVSGYSVRRVKPTNADAARSNVFPQSGPFVRYARKHPREKKPPTYTRTIRGTNFINHKPRGAERAWKGGVDKGPIKNQSATGSVRNTYSQKGPYVAYYKKHIGNKERYISNGRKLAQLKRLQPAYTGGSQGSIFPASISRIFMQRGKKNVYWGKVQKKEKGYTGDITGGPLRTRNFRTMPAGLHGRDTLKYFGKKPFGDRSNKIAGGGYQTATGKGTGGWKGDIAGWRLRKSAKGKKEVAGNLLFSRKLSISGSGKVGKPLPGKGLGGILSRKGSGIKPILGGGSINRNGWNNNRKPIGVRIPGNGSVRGARFSGNIPQGGVGFSRAGAGYAGNIKRSSVRGFSENGVGYSGNIRRGTQIIMQENGVNYSGKMKRSSIGFSDLGVGYSGNIKSKRQLKGGGSISGRVWNNGNHAIQSRPFSEQGGNYSGNIKFKRPEKGGGSISGRVWNNGNHAIQNRPPVSEQGGNYSGNIKFKRPEKGGGSISGRVWNNGNHAIQNRPPVSEQGGNYSGNIKFKRPEKGGGSVSGKVWNNGNHAIQTRVPLSKQGGDYSGNIKFKRPEKGGGSVSGKLINNNGQPIAVRTPKSDDANYSGRIALSRFKKTYVQNPNASSESIKKHRPDGTTYRVAGLQVKVKQGNYVTKPNASKYALLGIAPNKANARIADFQGNVKMHKYSGSRLHPDSQFAHGFRDNVKEERTLLMNVKLIWGKLFRKNETQPDNLKDKIQRPKYDKREKGMWND